MADIEKILDNLNLPKQILDKSEQLLKSLFSQSLDEVSGMIADQIKLRRFKNQIKIFSKAQEILKEHNIDPKRVSLKVLAPLIDLSSLEEEETLQNKWAKLIAYIVNGNQDVVFQQNCITILSKLTAEEAKLLEDLFIELQNKKLSRLERLVKQFEQRNKNYPNRTGDPQPQLEDVNVTDCPVFINKYVKEKLLDKKIFLFGITNLVALGILQWHTDVGVNASKRSSEPDDTDVDVDVYVSNNSEFIFTAVGERFMTLTKD